MSLLRDLLAHPLTRGLDVDDPRTTALRRRIVREKPFLRRIYEDWYRAIAAQLPPFSGPVLEIGSGAGFMSEAIPDLVTSEIFVCPDLDVVLDARKLPFSTGSLRAIVMTDVLHHIPDVAAFLAEAERVLRPGGRIVMIEPWNTPWARFIYQHFHPEPFRPDASDWTFPASGPLSGANGAIPWMVFVRDRDRFAESRSGLELLRVDRMMPFRYLVSGGVSMRSLTPAFSYSAWSVLESILAPFSRYLAMFALVVVGRRG